MKINFYYSELVFIIIILDFINIILNFINYYSGLDHVKNILYSNT